LERFDHPGRWLRVLGTFETCTQNFVRSPFGDQELVKSQRASFGMDERLHFVIRHRQHVRVHAQSFAHLLRHFGKLLSLIQHHRAIEYGCPVAIAYPQKLRLPKSLKHLVAEKCVTADAVPLVFIDDTSQRVHHGVDVWGDVQV